MKNRLLLDKISCFKVKSWIFWENSGCSSAKSGCFRTTPPGEIQTVSGQIQALLEQTQAVYCKFRLFQDKYRLIQMNAGCSRTNPDCFRTTQGFSRTILGCLKTNPSCQIQDVLGRIHSLQVNSMLIQDKPSRIYNKSMLVQYTFRLIQKKTRTLLCLICNLLQRFGGQNLF